MKTITLEQIGPVSKAAIPVPESGGVVVLRGRNGAGKTCTLNAVENLISGRGKPSVRDGALSGSVTGFGVTLKLARSSRRSGELEVTSLDGRLSVAELVDPGLKSADAADNKRIKALIQVAGIEPSPALFHELFGGRDQFEAVASSSAVECSDLVAMADRIKRDCEAAARKLESEADHADGRARGAMEAAGEIDPSESIHDADALQESLEKAISAKSKITEQLEAHQRAVDSAELAKHRLEKANADYDGLSLEDARHAEEVAGVAEQNISQQIAKLEAQLAEMRSRATEARNHLGAAITARKTAERHVETMAVWREQIEKTIPDKPSDKAAAKAAEELAAARAAVEHGAVVRAAIAKHREAEQHSSTALAKRKAAAELRSRAKGTDDVLSSVVAKAGTPLRVEAGRLVLSTKRGDTYYSELSHGERWKIALEVAIKAVGKGGVIVLQQEAWEGLDPMAREAIVEQVKGTDVVILTAECSADDEVNAEVFQ